ncbi:peptide methionine sulfoxide reductase [Leptotrichia trevisanii]|uniref:Peptide methionine sulfoxide reductase MsrA n=1 Tax=Leptotrichia trevisanii TaxID=109328 RepID=A0A510JZ22_9FUSO|nr:peptide-methionine (S)-S-oxide reductase MsrA [Leptotrichia trevisanii]BBM44257.1 peptide methionine sulfoxide reductase [Leptotrichia trevisanii]BBM51407.1 peptide methionine sulfoxide reductase [Leptotrichia trevisanii]
MADIKEIYLAGGCFWGVEKFFKMAPGVVETTVGYANGQTLDTNYDILKMTDHAETVHIKYDNEIVSLNKLLDYYFSIIDPTSINRQGLDEGRQYRTGIYYVDKDEIDMIKSRIESEQNKYSREIQVEVRPLKHYIKAEDYHQNYLDKNPNGYCHIDLANAKKVFQK